MDASSSQKAWYVYLLCDPDTEEPFYVGKGTGNRMNQHDKSPNYRSDNNEAKKEIIRKIVAQGKQVLKKKVAEFDNEQDAYAYEKSLIKLYGSQLTNIKSGGGPFQIHTERVYTEDDPYMPIEQVAKELGWRKSKLQQAIEILNIEKYRFKHSSHEWLARNDIERIREAKKKPWLMGPANT